MTAIIISSSGMYPFGTMTSQMVARLIAANAQVGRLQDAVTTASNGFTGTPGTEFEAPVVTGSPGVIPSATNLFGVTPNPDTPGAQGVAYADAVTSLATAWATFWTAAAPFVEQLDNGGTL
jgi:hypothetical protein